MDMDGMDAQHTLRLYKLRIVEGGEKKNCVGRRPERRGRFTPRYATLRVQGRRTQQQCACIICDMRIP